MVVCYCRMFFGLKGGLTSTPPPKIISSNQAPRRFNNKGRQELGWITNAFTRLHKCGILGCDLGWNLMMGGPHQYTTPKIISSNQAPRRFNKGRQELGWITNAFTRLHKCGILGCDMGSNLMMGGPTPVHHPQIISGLVDC